MPIQLLTTVKLKNYFSDVLDIHVLPDYPRQSSRFRAILHLWSQIARCDVFLSLSPSFEHIVFAGLHRFFFRQKKVIFFDIVLQRPTGLIQSLKAKLQRWMLKGVDSFLLIHKNYHEYQRLYDIPHYKVRYVPFKANNFEIRDQVMTGDDGYILSCGASFRDYDCFIEAARRLPTAHFVILKPEAERAAMHRTYFETRFIPDNIQVETDDMSQESWNRYIARAKIVVIPIQKECIQPAGISTYLESMVLRKPVIVSHGPSTDGILDSNMALMYEPGNAEDLSQCIHKLLLSEQLHQEIAEAGYRYAISLQGRERLVRDLERNVIEIYSKDH